MSLRQRIHNFFGAMVLLATHVQFFFLVQNANTGIMPHMTAYFTGACSFLMADDNTDDV